MKRIRRVALAALAFSASFGTATTPSPHLPVRGSAAPTQPACEQAAVTALLLEPSDPETGLRSGRFSILFRDPATAVTLVSPYFGSAHSDVPGTPRALTFLSGIRHQRTRNGFIRELTLDWFGDLELEIGAPGCPAVTVRCDARSCTRQTHATTPG